MPSRELSEWLAYSQIEALPDAHWDAALIASTQAACFAGKVKRPKLEDFLPRPSKRRRGRDDEPRVRLSAEQSRGILSRLMGVSPRKEID